MRMRTLGSAFTVVCFVELSKALRNHTSQGLSALLIAGKTIRVKIGASK